MGTPAYISPEQAQSRPVDQRSDIYSLGIILYEMVTGSVPFVADTPLAVILKHVSDPLPLPSVIKPDIPVPIEQVILKALAKNPSDRFATAAVVAAWKRALEQIENQHHAPETIPAVVEQSTPVFKQTEVKSVPAKKAEPKPRMPIGWIIGCLSAACLLLAVAGVAVLALNRQNFALFASTTATPLPTSTATIPPVTDTPLPLPTETIIPVSENNILLQDDFSTNQDAWGTLTDTKSSVKYENDSLHMLLFEKNYVIWSRPNDEDYGSVHVEVTAINNNTDSTTALGIVCYQQSEDWSFYYLAVTPAGEYAIIRATDGKDDVYLTNNGKWASSNLIKHNAASYHIGADCGGGTLTLYVEGHQIASATDSTYSTGHIGLFAWSGENVSSADVSFDDFPLDITSIRPLIYG